MPKNKRTPRQVKQLEEIVIIPSGRIDYCGACKAEHGYDCPLDNEDGVAFFSAKHPRPPFFKRIFQMIKAIFVRPKFSKEALEPAETLVFNDTWLIDGKEYTFQDRQNLYNFMLERGIIKEKPEKTIEDLKNEKK